MWHCRYDDGAGCLKDNQTHSIGLVVGALLNHDLVYSSSRCDWDRLFVKKILYGSASICNGANGDFGSLSLFAIVHETLSSPCDGTEGCD